mmetsp:Transcript_83196/g.254347  ORF Transcript_83196/g.254347 Transcript_83196/m.254347 type:complete len:246 (+) Transcript_83196:260-997(+)
MIDHLHPGAARAPRHQAEVLEVVRRDGEALLDTLQDVIGKEHVDPSARDPHHRGAVRAPGEDEERYGPKDPHQDEDDPDDQRILASEREDAVEVHFAGDGDDFLEVEQHGDVVQEEVQQKHRRGCAQLQEPVAPGAIQGPYLLRLVRGPPPVRRVPAQDDLDRRLRAGGVTAGLGDLFRLRDGARRDLDVDLDHICCERVRARRLTRGGTCCRAVRRRSLRRGVGEVDRALLRQRSLPRAFRRPG